MYITTCTYTYIVPSYCNPVHSGQLYSLGKPCALLRTPLLFETRCGLFSFAAVAVRVTTQSLLPVFNCGSVDEGGGGRLFFSSSVDQNAVVTCGSDDNGATDDRVGIGACIHAKTR